MDQPQQQQGHFAPPRLQHALDPDPHHTATPTCAAVETATGDDERQVHERAHDDGLAGTDRGEQGHQGAQERSLERTGGRGGSDVQAKPTGVEGRPSFARDGLARCRPHRISTLHAQVTDELAPADTAAADSALRPPEPEQRDKALDPSQHRPSAPQLHERKYGGLGS